MMARADLGHLLGNIGEAQRAPADAESAASAVRSTDTAKATEKDTASPRGNSPRVKGPRYLRFVRKDTRLREDQLAALTVASRQLNRQRNHAGERITENSLIRIAVDLLLEKIKIAAGSDEQSILDSLRK
jgi:pyruvate/2-oxoglutarate dehydrogenase complex dihydrolipoamide acyltransferase (E2) component